jgi:hypothetical protein
MMHFPPLPENIGQLDAGEQQIGRSKMFDNTQSFPRQHYWADWQGQQTVDTSNPSKNAATLEPERSPPNHQHIDGVPDAGYGTDIEKWSSRHRASRKRAQRSTTGRETVAHSRIPVLPPSPVPTIIITPPEDEEKAVDYVSHTDTTRRCDGEIMIALDAQLRQVAAPSALTNIANQPERMAFD